MVENKDDNTLATIKRKISKGATQTFTKTKAFFQAMDKPTRIFVLVLMIAVVVEIPLFLSIGMNAGGPNRAPTLGVISPVANINITEGDSMLFSVNPTDPDGDSLSFAWTVNGQSQVGNVSCLSFITNTTSSGSYVINVTVSDGVHQVVQSWNVTVINKLTRLGGFCIEEDAWLVADGVLYFGGGFVDGSDDYIAPGAELWRSDGTREGTYMVGDFRPGYDGSYPDDFAQLGDEIIFSMDNGTTGEELWKTDGTENGTVFVKDIYPGSQGSMIYYMTACNDAVFFTAEMNATTYASLWTSDGTPAGTRMVANLGSAYYLTSLGDLLLFQSNSHLWCSNGTTAGTQMVKDINTGGSDGIEFLSVVNGVMFFVANDGTHGSELWRSDGTANGTYMVKDVNGTIGTSYFTVCGNVLYYSCDDGINGDEVWRSNGTATGTYMLKDLNTTAGTGSSPEYFTTAGNYVYFNAEDGVSGDEVWRTDGTAAGTTLVADIVPGYNGADIDASEDYKFGATSNYVVFEADDDTHGNEPWVSDGTEAGTMLVGDIHPGSTGSSPDLFFSLGNAVLIWVTDDMDTYGFWVY
nr:Ig-like domain-containing protein [Candidatus Sigynarchaeota archaeon]